MEQKERTMHRSKAIGRSSALLCVVAMAAIGGAARAQIFTHTWDGTERTEAERILRDSVPSTCASPKSFPGTLSTTNFYQTYSFTNPVAANNDFTVTPLIEDVESFFSAYLGAFDPTNLALNYLGDQGASDVTFSFCV